MLKISYVFHPKGIPDMLGMYTNMLGGKISAVSDDPRK